MRYRPFGVSGAAISTLTLNLGVDALSRGVNAANDLIFSALEAGINSYRLETADPVLAEVVGQALTNVDRKLLNVSLQLGAGDGRRGSARDFSAEGMTGAIDRCLHVSGLGWIDVALLEEPGEDELPQSSLNALKALRATERVRYLGVSGSGEVMDAYVSTGAFDVLGTYRPMLATGAVAIAAALAMLLTLGPYPTPTPTPTPAAPRPATASRAPDERAPSEDDAPD